MPARCPACRAADVKRIQAIRLKRKLRGVCVYCGQEPAEKDHAACRGCLDVKRAKRAAAKTAVGYRAHRPA